MRKEQCAQQQRRCIPVGSGTIVVGGGCQASPALPPATLEVVRHYLREILQANTVVPLSNIKRIFRTRYQTELSETMLGHSRLSDLLQDRRFHDLCTVQLQRNGYAVIAQPGLQKAPMRATGPGFGCIAEEPPRMDLGALMSTPMPSPVVAGLLTPLPSPGVPPSARVRKWSTWRGNFQKEAAAPYHQQVQLSLDESLHGRHPVSSMIPAPQSRSHYGRDECFGLSLEPADGEAAVDVGPVTISLSLPTPLPSPGVPTSATQRGWSDKPRCTEFCKDEPLCLVPTPLASPGVPASAVTRKWAEMSQQPRWAEFSQHPGLTRGDSSDSTVSGDTLLSMVSFPWEPSGLSTAQGSLAGPTDDISLNASAGSLRLCDVSMQLSDVTGPDEEQGQRTPRWPNLITDVANWQMSAEPCFADEVSPILTLRKWKDMVVVRNTFIHAKMPPPTPMDSMQRSSSVPKDVGSNTGDASSEQQCNSRRWHPVTEESSGGQDGNGLGLYPHFSPQLGTESQNLGLEVDSSPKEEVVSPKASFDLQPTSLSAQAGRLGLTIQNTFVHTASVPLTPSSNREKRSSSTPPRVCRTAASGSCFGDQPWPLDLVSSMGRLPATSGCEAAAQIAEEEAVALKDHATTTYDSCDGADADALRLPPPRQNKRSAKLLELMPPCCRTFFHAATPIESTKCCTGVAER